MTSSGKDEHAHGDKPRKTVSMSMWAISIGLAIIALAAAFAIPYFSIFHPASPSNYCNDTNVSQSYCSTVATTNCVTPTGSLETYSIQCINGNYDYLMTVPSTHCGSEVADYFNVNTESGFSHIVSSSGTVTTYMSVAYNSTGIVTLAESAGANCAQSLTACLNYFAFATKGWSGFDCSFSGIGPTWTPSCYPFRVQLLNPSAILVTVVGGGNVTYSRLKSGNTLHNYVDSGLPGVPCL